MYIITEAEKQAYKQSGSVKRAYISIVPLSDDEEPIILDDNEYIKDFSILDEIYTPEQGIIGSVIAKQLTLNLFKPLDIDLTDRELEVYIGVEVEDEIKYIPQGRFLVQKPENETLKESTSLDALDYMTKFNLPYEDKLTYPCTIQDVLNSICNICGVECITTTFANSDFEVENNQFNGGESCRDVLKGIAQISGTYAKISRDNKLVLELLKHEQENINDNVYKDNLKINQKYGPVNKLILRMSQIEGENVVIQDDESIELNGLKELTIADNPFTYTQEKREKAINAIWDLVKGLTYIDYSAECVGIPYLDTGDIINITDGIDNSLCVSYIFSHEIKFNGGLSSSISATADTETETKYSFIPALSNRLTHAEISVDKANQKISAIIKETDGLNEKYTEMEGNIDRIKESAGLLGGNNLQENSIGAYGTSDYQQSETGEILATEDASIKFETDNGFGRIIYLKSEKWFKFKSKILSEGNVYTLSFKYTNMENNHCIIKIINGIETILVDTLEEKELEKIEYTFIANANYVELYVSTGDFTMGITDYYLQVGNQATQWQPASGEALSTSLEIYYNGIRVISENSGTITNLSSLGFSVSSASDLNKYFLRVDKDKCLLTNTEIDGTLDQKRWRRFVQTINGTSHLTEVKI